MHKKYSDEKIAALYHDYQNTRTGRRSQGRRAVLEVLNAHCTAIEQKTKQAVMARVMKVVKEKDRTHFKLSNGSRNISKHSLQQARYIISNIRTTIGKRFNTRPAWQYALPLLALGIILFGLLPQLSHKESSQTQVAVNQQDHLIHFSQQLAPLIQTITSTEFGFSGTRNAHTTAFHLGVISIDLPVLAHANNRSAVRTMLPQIQRAAKSAKQQEVEEQRLILKAALVKTTKDKSDIYIQSIPLAKSLKKLPNGSEQQAFFELGKWLELSLLTSLISDPDKKSDPFLKQQLNKRTGIFSQLKKNTPPDTQPLNRLLAELDVIASSETLQALDLRELQHKLNQLKAVLQE